MQPLKVFSMFSGIGGFEYGLHLSGIPFELIGHSEIDMYADSVYTKHFGGWNYGDATRINTRELPAFDLLCAGFPCQAFSIAGEGKGELDTRGTLYNEILRVLTNKRPRYFILENVKNLLSVKHRQTFVTIIKGFTSLGYHVEWAVCNSKFTGVPQNRERVYITGYIGNRSGGWLLPLREGNTEDTGRVGVDTSYCIDASYWKGTNTTLKGRRQLILQVNKPVHSNDRVYSVKGIAPALNTMQGGRIAPFIKQELQVRMLTPLECERVQGFPDNWTQTGFNGRIISKTQRYKMIGNSVTPQVACDVITKLIQEVK